LRKRELTPSSRSNTLSPDRPATLATDLKVKLHEFLTVTPTLPTTSGTPLVRKEIYKPFADYLEEDAWLLTQALVPLPKALHSNVLAKGAERNSSPNV
jgi:hypothetical protein